jgi:hypothetical protein
VRDYLGCPEQIIFQKSRKEFLQSCIKEEKILALTLAKVLRYNLEEIGFK